MPPTGRAVKWTNSAQAKLPVTGFIRPLFSDPACRLGSISSIVSATDDR